MSNTAKYIYYAKEVAIMLDIKEREVSFAARVLQLKKDKPWRFTLTDVEKLRLLVAGKFELKGGDLHE